MSKEINDIVHDTGKHAECPGCGHESHFTKPTSAPHDESARWIAMADEIVDSHPRVCCGLLRLDIASALAQVASDAAREARGSRIGFCIRHPGGSLDAVHSSYMFGTDPEELKRRFYEGFNPVHAVYAIKSPPVDEESK